MGNDICNCSLPEWAQDENNLSIKANTIIKIPSVFNEKVRKIYIANQVNMLIKHIRKFLILKRQKNLLNPTLDSQSLQYITIDQLLPEEGKTKYIGNLNNKIREGLGIQQWENGTILIGIFHNHKVNGFVKLTLPNSNRFKGEFINDKANGYGQYTFTSNGSIYEGYWKNDKQNNIGIEKWSGGDSYMGEYAQGKKNGIGFYQWSNGTKYYGEFKDNCVNGRGVYIYEGRRTYKGEFKMNYMNGYGEMIYHNNGSIYLGYWVRNKKEGFGILLRGEKNKVLIGFWKNNKMHGIGKIIMKGEKKIYAIWKDNKVVQKIKDTNQFYSLLNKSNCEKYKEFFSKSFESLQVYINIFINN